MTTVSDDGERLGLPPGLPGQSHHIVCLGQRASGSPNPYPRSHGHTRRTAQKLDLAGNWRHARAFRFRDVVSKKAIGGAGQQSGPKAVPTTIFCLDDSVVRSQRVSGQEIRTQGMKLACIHQSQARAMMPAAGGKIHSTNGREHEVCEGWCCRPRRVNG